MVGQTSGLPVKLPFDGEKYYSKYAEILPGAWTLGDILEEEGYNQVILMGSDSSFAGRGDYFTQHGNYTINDYTYYKLRDIAQLIDMGVTWNESTMTIGIETTQSYK